MLHCHLSVSHVTVALAAYEWLVCYLLRESHQKLSQEKQSETSDSAVRNNCQVRGGLQRGFLYRLFLIPTRLGPG